MASAAKPEFIIPEVVEDHLQRRVIHPQTGKSQLLQHTKRYNRMQYLGKGGFARCYELVSQDSNRHYAGKIIPKQTIVKEVNRKKLMNEINIHRSLSHRNVVKFERFFEDKNNVYILLELCPNQTLMELVRRRGKLSEPETQYYMMQLLDVCIHLHGKNIIHRDLKLGNLFLYDNMEIKVGDFGLATQLNHEGERKKTICGTPNYIAPEILDNTSYNGHSFEVDTWALGVIMYTMLVGQPPFETQSIKTTYKKIRETNYDFPATAQLSPAAKLLIQKILHADPNKRPALRDVKNDLFFTQSPIPASLPISCLTQDPKFPHTIASFEDENERENEDINIVRGKSKKSSPSKISSAEKEKNRALFTSLSTVPQSNTDRMPLSDRQSYLNAAPAFASAGPPRLNLVNQKKLAAAASSATTAASSLSSLASSSTLPSKLISPQRKATTGSSTSTAAPRALKFSPLRPSSSTANATSLSKLQKNSSSSSLSSNSSNPSGSISPSSSSSSATTTSNPPDIAALSSCLSSLALGSRFGFPKLSGDDKENFIADEPLIITGNKESSCDEEETQSLKKMHGEIEKSFSAMKTAPASTVTPSTQPVPIHVAKSPLSVQVPSEDDIVFGADGQVVQKGEDLWVSKWVDYSSKYGLGYLLSNGVCGVYFNDSSKIVMNPSQTHFDYIERRTANGTGGHKETHSLEEYPAPLTKKVTLLKHFSNYLTSNKSISSSSLSQPNPKAYVDTPRYALELHDGVEVRPPSPISDLVYVKKWLRTKHAIFFRLSNRTVQVIFLDQTELVLSSIANTVSYTDKNRLKSVYAMENSKAIQERADLSKRMKYTKDILHHLLNNNAANVSPTKPLSPSKKSIEV